MTTARLAPNELADLYDGLLTVLEYLPEDTHPGWRYAVESIVFGGDGLRDGALSYGEQQAARNNFTIHAYRDRYGDGERVTAFPAIETASPRQQDQQCVPASVRIPVGPNSGRVLPLYVDHDTYPDAIQLLSELPAEPDAEMAGDGQTELLNPARFPTAAAPPLDDPVAQDRTAEEGSEIPPNELADLYEVFRYVLANLPSDVQPVWREAIESITFGGDALAAGAASYGEQQGERNRFGMPAYRDQYGDGEWVTEFPAIETTTTEVGGKRVTVPVAPTSGRAVPLQPDATSLERAIELLQEFPPVPAADTPGEQVDALLAVDSLPLPETTDEQDDSTGIEADSRVTSESPQTPVDESPPERAAPSSPSLDDEIEILQDEVNTYESRVLRSEGVGEGAAPAAEVGSPEVGYEPKYDDPRAEAAHRRALRRDPADVVALGEEITLVLKEADYSRRPPTIMGTKEKLVIFVVDAPQDLERFDTIRAKVIDYGGKRNCAEAAFLGYH